MHLRASALILSVRPHGENGAIVRALTQESGVLPGYVRGGNSRRMRPVLQPANAVIGEWRARSEAALPALTLELTHSRAGLYGEPLAAAALEWASVLTATALPEGQPYPEIHAALDGLLSAIEAAPSARGWASALVRYELLLLTALGFGLDLSRCAVTGASENLSRVSPRSGRAVSEGAAKGYEERLFRLPSFLVDGGPAIWLDILSGLSITGHFLARDILTDRRADILAGRERLLDRLKRAVA